MSELNDSEIKDLANIATRLKAENLLAAEQIVELQGDVAELTAALKEQSGSWAVTVGVILLVGLCAFTLGWRMGSMGQFDAGYRMCVSEADECPR